MRYMVTGWSNADGKLLPLQAEFETPTYNKREIVEKGIQLLTAQINDELGDHWLNDVKFWQVGGITWQLVEDLNDCVQQCYDHLWIWKI